MTDYTIPDTLREIEQWVLWNGDSKVPLAPWTTGDMFPAGWGDGVVNDPESRMEERPETSLETAKRYATSRPEVLQNSYPFPRNDDGTPDIPETLLPTIILPHYPPDLPVMFIDFDDVRDPETGELSDEVEEILDRLDAFTEVSSSGTGIHAFVRAELPGGLGKFIGDLDDIGHIELYDHGRFVGCTWEHLPDTPVTVPERQEVVTDLIETYEDDAQHRRRTRESSSPDDVEDILASIRGDDQSNTSRSEYYDLDIRDVADTGDFGGYRKQAPGGEWDGPHPSHGPKHSAKTDCTNFGVESRKNAWYCRLHDVGGGPLSLIAVLEDIVSCNSADDIHRDNELLLKACIAARDDYSASLDGADPPYGALVAVAKRHELAMADSEQEILGEDTWRLARIIYENTTTEEL